MPDEHGGPGLTGSNTLVVPPDAPGLSDGRHLNGSVVGEPKIEDGRGIHGGGGYPHPDGPGSRHRGNAVGGPGRGSGDNFGTGLGDMSMGTAASDRPASHHNKGEQCSGTGRGADHESNSWRAHKG
ncbi:hypothetical protein GCM10010359_17380 [Streptomyces morookaense]|nr:hypothetical protein GCM10010359_17380 [Streptomyces morookaense]